MSVRRDVRHGVRIGRAEFVRSGRRYVRDKRRLAGIAVAMLFLGGNFLFTLPAAYVAGLEARSVTAIPFFEPAATLLPVALLLLATSRTLEQIGAIEAEELMLMTVHPRAVVVGLIGAEVARLAVWFGVPLVLLATAFALGLGAPSLVVTGALVALPVACWAAVWGYALGIGVLRLLRRLPGVRRLLKVAGVVAMVGAVVGSQVVGQYVADGAVSVTGIAAALTFEPASEFLALAFVGTPLARPVSATALAMLAGLLALTPVGLAVVTRQVSVLWFTDAPDTAGSRRTSTKTSAGGFAPRRPFAWTKAGRVAWGLLVRGVRKPQEFSHLLMILFFAAPVGTTLVRSSGDSLGPIAAGMSVGLGVYLAGATFGLNPLGDDRPQLPVLLLSGTSPSALVRGRSVAGLAVGVPVAVLVPVASIAAGTSLTQAVAFAGVGVAFCLAAALFAVGLGAAYPIYEAREFWGSETVVPSTLVMMTYVFVVGGGTAIGLVGTWYAVTGRLVATPVFAVGCGVYLLLTAGLSFGSYRYAIRRYRRYTTD